MTEIHNGFCPLYNMFGQVIFSIGEQLVVIWFAAPVLQNFVFFFVQLFTCMLEPLLDLFVTIMESFVSLIELIPGSNTRRQSDQATGMNAETFDIYCAEHPGQTMCQNDDASSSSRRMLGENGKIPMQDELLEVCCVIFTVMVRLAQAFLYILLPILYGFLRRVLPVMLTAFPVAFEICGHLATMFTSDALRRIVDGLIQMLPVLLEIIGSIVCGLVIYLGSAVCYIIYGIIHLLKFVLRYMLRPCVCGCLAMYAGCFEAFVMAGVDGKSCYTCGQYNTACGCRKQTYPSNGCGGDCMDVSNPANPVVVTIEPIDPDKTSFFGRRD
jgi:hypothetical protein